MAETSRHEYFFILLLSVIYCSDACISFTGTCSQIEINIEAVSIVLIIFIVIAAI